MDHGSWIMDHGSWIMDHGSWIMESVFTLVTFLHADLVPVIFFVTRTTPLKTAA